MIHTCFALVENKDLFDVMTQVKKVRSLGIGLSGHLF